MIEYIHIKNFQCQLDTKIIFSELNTAITGLSMAGKTSIKRAFEFVRKNRPSGMKFNYRYNNPLQPVSVEIGVDGYKVKLIKSNKALDKEGNKAIYSITDKNGDIRKFTAFGTNVPDEVKKILNVSNISIQDQLDAYLLVISSSGEIARTINNITGIDIGDKWIKEINKTYSNLRTLQTQFDNDKLISEVEFKKFEKIDKLEKLQKKGEKLQADYIKIKNDIEYLQNLISIICDSEERISLIKNQLEVLQEFNKKIIEIESILVSKNEFIKNTFSIVDTNDKINKINNALSKLKPYLKQIQEIKEKEKFNNEIIRITDNFYFHDSKIEEIKKEIQECKNKFKNELLRLGKCFICNNKLDKNTISEVIK